MTADRCIALRKDGERCCASASASGGGLFCWMHGRGPTRPEIAHRRRMLELEALKAVLELGELGPDGQWHLRLS